MTKEMRTELEKKLERLEYAEFMIHMADHWTPKYKEDLKKVENEIKEIKKVLNDTTSTLFHTGYRK